MKLFDDAKVGIGRAITASRLNEAGFCRTGNSWNVCSSGSLAHDLVDAAIVGQQNSRDGRQPLSAAAHRRLMQVTTMLRRGWRGKRFSPRAWPSLLSAHKMHVV